MWIPARIPTCWVAWDPTLITWWLLLQSMDKWKVPNPPLGGKLVGAQEAIIFTAKLRYLAKLQGHLAFFVCNAMSHTEVLGWNLVHAFMAHVWIPSRFSHLCPKQVEWIHNTTSPLSTEASEWKWVLIFRTTLQLYSQETWKICRLCFWMFDNGWYVKKESKCKNVDVLWTYLIIPMIKTVWSEDMDNNLCGHKPCFIWVGDY